MASTEKSAEVLGMPDITLLSGCESGKSSDVVSAAPHGAKNLFDQDTQNAPSVAHLFGLIF